MTSMSDSRRASSTSCRTKRAPAKRSCDLWDLPHTRLWPGQTAHTNNATQPNCQATTQNQHAAKTLHITLHTTQLHRRIHSSRNTMDTHDGHISLKVIDRTHAWQHKYALQERTAPGFNQHCCPADRWQGRLRTSAKAAEDAGPHRPSVSWAALHVEHLLAVDYRLSHSTL